MAFTVTATPGGASFQRGVDLLVRVLTNATENGGASHGQAVAAAGNPQGSLTPNFSGSFVAFGLAADNVTTMGAAATSNTYDYSPGGHTDTWCARMGHYSGTVTGGTPLTYGAASAAGDDHYNTCAYEIPASGGTITVDGSSPAGVFSDTGTSNTTASFTPPAGSVLVAIVGSGGSGAGAGQTCTMSDTSGLGLTWTLRKQSSTSDNFQVTFIFTATVPQPTQSGQQVGDVWGDRDWPAPMARAFGPNVPFETPEPFPFTDPPPPPPPGVPPPPPLPLPPAMGHGGLPGMPGGEAFDLYPDPDDRIGNVDPPYITGLAGTNYQQYFVDNLGNPVLLLSEQCWALPWNAGRWNGGNWQYDFAEYFSARAKQGYNAWFGVPFGTFHVDSTALTGGRTWDGIYPFLVNGTAGPITSSGQTVALNAPFWDRFAAMVDTARQHGIACFANLSLSYNISDANGVWSAAGNTQATTLGAALGTRFPRSKYPNLHWFFGDDDDGPNDSFYSSLLSGIQSTEPNQPLISDEQFTNTNCHVSFSAGGSFAGSFGVANSTYNFVYSYDAPYFGVETSYTEGGTYPKIPPIYGDGVYYGDTGSGTVPDRVMRTFAWWALSSGARGFTATSGPSDLGGGGLWTWQADATTRLRIDPNGNGQWCNVQAGAIRGYLAGLTDFQKLIPDTSNAFITAGRGTRGTCDAAGGVFNFRNTSTYVSGSITPTGTLAVIYCKSAMSITIDQTKLGAGYTATWVDPANLATQSASTGSTYSSSGLGNNSAGDSDWVIVFQSSGVAGTAASGSGSLTLSGSATASGAGSTASGSLTLSGTATFSEPAAGSVTLSGSAVASEPAAGSVTLSGSAVTSEPASGSISLSGSAVQSEPASGSVTLSGSATASEPGSGSVTLTGAADASGRTASGSVTLQGIVNNGGGSPASGTAAVTLTGAADASGRTASGSVSLSGSAGTTEFASGSVSLSGAVTARAATAGSALLSLAGSAAAAARAAGSAVLSLLGIGTATDGTVKTPYIELTAPVRAGRLTAPERDTLTAPAVQRTLEAPEV